MNWILCLTKNNLHLTRNAVETFLVQDIGDVKVLIIDDDSTDGTLRWAWTRSEAGIAAFPGIGLGVAASWNMGLEFIFRGSDHALVVNNDVELRPDTYRWLLEDGGGFVTAVGSQDPEKIKPNYEGHITKNPYYNAPDVNATRPHPDFSCYLIRKETYEKVGPFDEEFKGAFCEDWDYHVRLHEAGVDARSIDLPFLHLSSMTVKNSLPKEKEKIYAQAARNREYFQIKHGVKGGSPEYYALFAKDGVKST